jgi:NADPH:quinone reductase-like Zn-dependent oxidoreductase
LFETVTDVAGEIAEVGSAVRDLKIGDKVLSRVKTEILGNSKFKPADI